MVLKLLSVICGKKHQQKNTWKVQNIHVHSACRETPIGFRSISLLPGRRTSGRSPYFNTLHGAGIFADQLGLFISGAGQFIGISSRSQTGRVRIISSCCSGFRVDAAGAGTHGFHLRHQHLAAHKCHLLSNHIGSTHPHLKYQDVPPNSNHDLFSPCFTSCSPLLPHHPHSAARRPIA